MGRQKYMEDQIAFAPRQAESGASVAEIIRRFGVDPFPVESASTGA